LEEPHSVPLLMKQAPIFLIGGTYISRIKSREGPTVSFVCMYKDACVIKLTKKDIIKFCQMNKGTRTREAFDAWWDEHCLQDEVVSDQDVKQIVKDSWGPEAHEEEPNENTKTVI